MVTHKVLEFFTCVEQAPSLKQSNLSRANSTLTAEMLPTVRNVNSGINVHDVHGH